MTADICDHSEEHADMWHGTVHGPHALDFSRTSKQDHVRAHGCMYAHVRIRFGDVSVLLRNSKDQKVRKLESEKRWEKIALGRDLVHFFPFYFLTDERSVKSAPFPKMQIACLD